VCLLVDENRDNSNNNDDEERKGEAREKERDNTLIYSSILTSLSLATSRKKGAKDLGPFAPFFWSVPSLLRGDKRGERRSQWTESIIYREKEAMDRKHYFLSL